MVALAAPVPCGPGGSWDHLLLLNKAARAGGPVPFILHGRRARSRAAAITSVERQDFRVSGIKREQWTEGEVLAMPTGEHDYFERKSGLLFSDDQGLLLGKLAKALSAIANSGGGHIFLGVADDGTIDGCPCYVGKATTRDWLEQKVPRLLDYALSDFRVHSVVQESPSVIPPGRDLIVIDVGDSPLSPHQCAHGGGDARKGVYYHRQGGRSEPAPHFYLELLRQRLVSPQLELIGVELVPVKTVRADNRIFVSLRARLVLENTGRIAAYKWAVHTRAIAGHPNDRDVDFEFDRQRYPIGAATGDSGIRLDDTLLPGSKLDQALHYGVFLNSDPTDVGAFTEELEAMITSTRLEYQVATETSLSDLRTWNLSGSIKTSELRTAILKQLP